MELMKKSLVLAAAVALALGAGLASVSAGEDTQVTASGTAKIIKGDKEAAKKAALDEAKRAAVEQVGAEVVAQTVVENFELVKDQIISQAKGYVYNVKVLEEGSREGSYFVKIQATVNPDKVKEDATVIYREMDKPRMMVLVTEAVGEKELKSSAAENVISESLLEKGFQMIDQAVAKENIKKDELRLAAEGNAKAAAKIGLRSGAEVIIIGTATVGDPEEYMSLYFSESVVSLKAIKTDNANLYAAISKPAKSQAAIKTAAGPNAVRKASKEAAREIFWRIVKAWNDEKLRGIKIEVVLSGVNYSSLQKVKKSLKKLDGVTELNERSFDSPTATLDLTFKGDSKRLAEVISNTSFTGFRLEIIGRTPGKIELKVK
jgi:hypothetical protein